MSDSICVRRGIELCETDCRIARCCDSFQNGCLPSVSAVYGRSDSDGFFSSGPLRYSLYWFFFFFYLVETITDTKAFLSVLFHKRPPLMVLLASWWDDEDVFLQSNIFKRWWSLGELLETLLLQNNVLITCNFGKLLSVSLWSTPDGEKSEKWEKNQGKVL